MTIDSEVGLTLDAGALIALDRGSRRQWAFLRSAIANQVRPVVPAPVLTEVWRSPRQAQLGQALRWCRVEPTDERLARAAGLLCARAGTDDPVDAIVVASAARRGDAVVTSDPGDISRLAAHTPNVGVVAAGDG